MSITMCPRPEDRYTNVYSLQAYESWAILLHHQKKVNNSFYHIDRFTLLFDQRMVIARVSYACLLASRDAKVEPPITDHDPITNM